MKNKAYSILNVKSFDDEKRIITGVATTPSLDRAGDTVQPLGAKFMLPLPLLFHHNHEMPIGKVTKLTVTKDGILFEAEIAKIEEEGILKNRTDEAWQSVKSGLTSAVSIGFSSSKYSSTKTGIDFEEWEMYELSLVTIPANRDATIQTIKSLFDNNATVKNEENKKTKSTGVTVKYKITKEEIKMNYAEQIKSLKLKMAENAKKIQEMATKSADAGETFNEKEAEEFDSLDAENTAIEAQIKRLEVAQKAAGATATPVVADSHQSSVVAEQKGNKSVNYANVKSDGKTYNVSKAVRAIAMAKGNPLLAVQIAESKYSGCPQVKELVQHFTKADVPVASTSNEPYLGVLTPAAGRDLQDFLYAVEPMSVFGQMNIPEIGFYSRWAEQLTTGDAYWTGEGQRKGATAFSVSDSVLLPLKLATLAALTEEVVADSTGVKADALTERVLGRAIAARIDTDMFDPTKAAVAGVSPASFTYGAPAIVSTGNARLDIRNLVRVAQQAAQTREGIVLIVDDLSLQDLIDTQTDLGVDVFKDLATNGTIGGIKVISSAYFRQFADSSGGFAVVMREEDFRVAQSPGLIVKHSSEASAYVSTDGQTNLRHAFQENLLLVLVEKRINWTKARANPAIAYMTGINWAPVA